MSRLNDLIRQVGLENEALAAELQREVSALADRRSFGLNFERHVPEAVELPGRPVRRGDKVRILPPRGKTPKQADEKLWRVRAVKREGSDRMAELVALADEADLTTVNVEDLVVVAEFRDPIYPGLVSTGKVERGGDKPFHTVINAENYHALQALLYTHRSKVDCIYIDPPYNTGARDWKYNNDYVEGDDLYRHSKWLAFMERRLLLARELLKTDHSLLIVTIDEKEYLRLGLLLEQVFPNAHKQMVSSVINRKGVVRANEFTRTNEFIYFLQFGAKPLVPEISADDKKVRWASLRRFEDSSRRRGPQPRPDQFYPIYIGQKSGKIEQIGSSISLEVERETVPGIPGTIALWPLKPDGTEMIWGLTPATLRKRLERGFVKVVTGRRSNPPTLYYLTSGQVAGIDKGDLVVTGKSDDGSAVVEYSNGKASLPTTQWDRDSHNAQTGGTNLLASLLPSRRFPFAKSLYAVEDCVRLGIGGNRDAVILDFFSGSGTTAHAVARLNKQDGGRRQCISVTNNEVSAEEQKGLRKQGLRPGDAEWERWGICNYITDPRLEAAITGKTPEGNPIKGDYKFTDEFPMSDGFEENVEFFTMTYEAPLRVASHRDFERIAPLLWLRAGSRGRRIEDLREGWDVAETYGVLADLDQVEPFLKAIAENDEVRIVYVVTDEDRLFESVVRELPDHVEPVRLYASYLRNFEIESGRGLR